MRGVADIVGKHTIGGESEQIPGSLAFPCWYRVQSSFSLLCFAKKKDLSAIKSEGWKSGDLGSVLP